MSVEARQVTFLVVVCDLCRLHEYRSHEAPRGDGDLLTFLNAHEGQAQRGAVAAGWMRTRGGDGRFVCPSCIDDVQGNR
jgi:hypothetical protein